MYKPYLYLFGTLALLTVLIALGLRRCTNFPYSTALNHPNYLYLTTTAEMKSMDPQYSYYSHENEILSQIYEGLYTYHYLKRPYELIPALADTLPQMTFFDRDGKVVTDAEEHPEKVARTEYIIKLKKGVLYQPHPAFARDENGALRYHNLKPADVKKIYTPNEFPFTGTREVCAEDVCNSLKRICDERLASPVYANFETFIAGMDACRKAIAEEVKRAQKNPNPAYCAPSDINYAIDYSKIPLEGVVAVDSHTLKVTVTRKFPQTIYWMAMNFFAPVPQEVLNFYAQKPCYDQLLLMMNWPVGTGPYMMQQYEPMRQIVMTRNPNHRIERYPSTGSEGDEEAGLLKDAGKRLPFADGIVFVLEREFIPGWTKFLQGYYDNSGISSDMFDRAVNMSENGDMGLSPEMEAAGMKMCDDPEPAIMMYEFNMLDPVVGGNTKEKIALRRAISIALDFNEFINIFASGRGKQAQSVIPPGVPVFGTHTGEAGVNPYTDYWDPVSKKYRRQSIEKARELMVEAGYPGGIGANGKRLEIVFDHSAGGMQGFKAQLQWFTKQFAKIGITLRENPTDINRFRDKVETGNWQTALSGWVADYPDAENFFFLFYGPNNKVNTGGANSVNYMNEEYDKVFKQLEAMENSPARQKVIDRADEILRREAVACFGYGRSTFVLYHGYLSNVKPTSFGRGFYKYYNIDTERRMAYRAENNHPETNFIWWCWGIFIVVFVPPLVYNIAKKQKEVV